VLYVVVRHPFSENENENEELINSKHGLSKGSCQARLTFGHVLCIFRGIILAHNITENSSHVYTPVQSPPQIQGEH
jgi:hypothetical protein